jgi:hypothetical protein
MRLCGERWIWSAADSNCNGYLHVRLRAVGTAGRASKPQLVPEKASPYSLCICFCRIEFPTQQYVLHVIAYHLENNRRTAASNYKRCQNKLPRCCYCKKLQRSVELSGAR